jgi:hypothetical protein
MKNRHHHKRPIFGPTPTASTPVPPTPPPPTGKLSTPTINPNTHPNSNQDVTLACVDRSHLFYTLDVNPVDPTHSGDTPTGSTVRIASNVGVVNSGPDVKKIKVLAYRPGYIDSDIAASDTYGTPIPVNRDILTGLGHLLGADRVGDRLNMTEVAALPSWGYSYVDFFRWRTGWDVLQPTANTFDWASLDTFFALCATHNKYATLSVQAGKSTPQWVYDSGAYKYAIRDPSNQGYQPLPWDPDFQGPWFAFLDALATRYASNDRLRAMIAAGFMIEFGMNLGDTTDEVQMPVVPYGFTNTHDAYRDAAPKILDKYMSVFSVVGHAITYTKVWPDNMGTEDANFVRDTFQNAYLGRAGTIITSLRAELPPHQPPPPSELSNAPRYAQMFMPMTVGNPKCYVPPPPVPLPVPLVCLEDGLENCVSKAKQYAELYHQDLELAGAATLLETERAKLKANLIV